MLDLTVPMVEVWFAGAKLGEYASDVEALKAASLHADSLPLLAESDEYEIRRDTMKYIVHRRITGPDAPALGPVLTISSSALTVTLDRPASGPTSRSARRWPPSWTRPGASASAWRPPSARPGRCRPRTPPAAPSTPPRSCSTASGTPTALRQAQGPLPRRARGTALRQAQGTWARRARRSSRSRSTTRTTPAAPGCWRSRPPA